MIADVGPLCRGITRICDHTQPPIGLHNNNHTKWSSNPLNIGHCYDNKITLAYHANPLTRHKSGHYFWIESASQGSEPSSDLSRAAWRYRAVMELRLESFD